MAMVEVDEHRDVSGERAQYLVNALREAPFADFMSEADREKFQALNVKLPATRTHADAVWLVQVLAAITTREEPKVKKVVRDNGHNPQAIRPG